MLKEACARVESEHDPEKDGCIVLASRDWHMGVVGIVAARLVERYYRPTVLLAIGSDGLAQGSARSIAGFHLCEGLKRCEDLLIRYGGHYAAAGLTLLERRIPTFRERFSSAALEALSREAFCPRQMIDASVEWEELTLRLVSELDGLAPFGPANPEPTLLLRAITPVNPRIVGDNHLKLSVRRPSGPSGPVGDGVLDVIGFRMGDRMAALREGAGMDLAFVPERNIWQGRERIQLRLKDIRRSVED